MQRTIRTIEGVQPLDPADARIVEDAVKRRLPEVDADLMLQMLGLADTPDREAPRCVRHGSPKRLDISRNRYRCYRCEKERARWKAGK